MQKTIAPNAPLAVEKDLELKAYIYQQIAEIQPYLVADSQVSVAVEEVKEKRKKREILVTLTASVEEGEMEVDGQGPDFYDAFNLAKEKMLQQLAELQNSSMDSGEREMIVQSAMNGGLTIH